MQKSREREERERREEKRKKKERTENKTRGRDTYTKHKTRMLNKRVQDSSE